jgi:hypothetical protein
MRREITLTDFTLGESDSEQIADLIYAALIDLGYEDVSAFNWEIKVDAEYGAGC